MLLNTVFQVFCFKFRELGETLTDDDLRAMIDEFDLDQDGESKIQLTPCSFVDTTHDDVLRFVVDLEEFVAIMTGDS